ncbi:MAG TPA: tail fiber domain-containing protein [Bacteroidota bacterium]|nr:tail fiber domain-containing protein [Bacteroidota bacterium]
MKHVVPALLLLWSLFVSTPAVAQLPQTLSYQGYISTTGGLPVHDSSYVLTFKLYTVSSGGSPLWTEAHNNVATAKGTFTVILGTITSLTGVDFNQQLYIGITKGADPEFSPRSALTSAPSSLAPWAVSDTNITYTKGRVGIGTTTPLSQLHVKGESPVRFMGDLSTLAGAEYVDFMARNSPYSTDIGGIRIQRDTVSGDVNTSVFAAAAGSGSYEKMRVTGHGNVGIGTTNPLARLDVRGDGFFGMSSIPDIGTDGTNVFVGNTGGDIHNSFRFDAWHDNLAIIGRSGAGSATGTSISFRTQSAANGEADRMSIDQYGDVSIGTYSTTQEFSVSTASGIAGYMNSLNGTGVYGQSTGSGGSTHYGLYAWANNASSNYGVFGWSPGGANSYGGYFQGNLGYTGNLVGPSDEKLKENIETYSGALAHVMSLIPRTYNFKKGGEFDRFSFSPEKHFGFIAQEVENVFPELVVTTSLPQNPADGPDSPEKKITYKGMKTMELIPILVAAMQEQQKLIEELKAKVEQLEKK